MVKLYINAQNKFILMNLLPFSNNFTNDKILYRSSESIITSEALIFNSDLALILIPIDAY